MKISRSWKTSRCLKVALPPLVNKTSHFSNLLYIHYLKTYTKILALPLTHDFTSHFYKFLPVLGVNFFISKPSHLASLFQMTSQTPVSLTHITISVQPLKVWLKPKHSALYLNLNYTLVRFSFCIQRWQKYRMFSACVHINCITSCYRSIVIGYFCLITEPVQQAWCQQQKKKNAKKIHFS